MDLDFTLETITPDASTILTIGGAGALQLPSGVIGSRPSGAGAGALRWNTSTPQVEYYNGSAWSTFSAGVTTITGTAGITANVSTGAVTLSTPITSSGDLIIGTGTDAASRLAIGTTGQILSVVSGLPSWSTVGTSAYSVNVGPSGTVSWTLVSGNIYNAVITHGLGTQNVIVQMADISTNNVVQPDLITINSSSQITVQIAGTSVNTKTLRIVVIANGASIAAGASTPSSVIIQNNGVALSGTYTTINLTGTITASNSGSNVATLSSNSVIRQLSYFATSLDSPNNADWVVNALAPTVADPTYSAINVRQYSNTVEQGVGLYIPVPSNASNITFTYRGRPATAPGTASTVQMKLYSRALAQVVPGAVPAWSGATSLTAQVVPTNAFIQTYTQTYSLSALSLVAGDLYQFEFTRAASGVSGVWLMVSLDVIFT